MSKNSAAHEKKVEHAVWKLLKHPSLSIPNAMVLAEILKMDACCLQKRVLGPAPGSKETPRPSTLARNLRDDSNKTYSVQCNNQLDNDVTIRQLRTF